jgi:DtxR family transcriptional regulator, Mn-dependent transcriptional regulator
LGLNYYLGLTSFWFWIIIIFGYGKFIVLNLYHRYKRLSEMPDPMISLLVGLALLGIGIFFFWPNGGLIGLWSRVHRVSSRVLHEDALKHIHRTERYGHPASIHSVAGALEVSTGQAAEILASLEKKELIFRDGADIRLTPSGREYALRIIRAHRLYERYLAEETGYVESEWHDQAEQYEHRLTPEAANALSVLLGHPTHDPHGDPIPTADGEMVLHGGQPMTSAVLNQTHLIVHIEDEPNTIYAQLVAEGLYPGMEVILTEKTSQLVRFWANGDEHVLAPIVAANISVLPISQEAHVEINPGESLDTLKPGESARIVQLSPRLRGSERRRMMDLGILPGTSVQAEMISPTGDPTAYRIRGALIALREEQANMILIDRQKEVEA